MYLLRANAVAAQPRTRVDVSPSLQSLVLTDHVPHFI